MTDRMAEVVPSTRAKRRKPPSHCKACNHSQRAAIDRAIIDREPHLRIANLFGLTAHNITAHEKHVEGYVIRALTPKEGSSLLDRVERATRKVEQLVENNDAPRVLLPAIRELREQFQLIGRLTGEIAPPQIQAVFVDLGVGSADEAKRIIADYRRLSEGVSLDEAKGDAVETLKLWLHEHPEGAGDLRRELFGEMEVEDASEVLDS